MADVGYYGTPGPASTGGSTTATTSRPSTASGSAKGGGGGGGFEMPWSTIINAGVSYLGGVSDRLYSMADKYVGDVAKQQQIQALLRAVGVLKKRYAFYEDKATKMQNEYRNAIAYAAGENVADVDKKGNLYISALEDLETYESTMAKNLDDLFDSQSTSIKRQIKEQTAAGVLEINDKFEQGLSELRMATRHMKENAGYGRRAIQRQMSRADKAVDQEYKRTDEQLKELEKKARDNKRTLRGQAARRGLGFSGFMIAAIKELDQGTEKQKLKINELSKFRLGEIDDRKLALVDKMAQMDAAWSQGIQKIEMQKGTLAMQTMQEKRKLTVDMNKTKLENLRALSQWQYEQQTKQASDVLSRKQTITFGAQARWDNALNADLRAMDSLTSEILKIETAAGAIGGGAGAGAIGGVGAGGGTADPTVAALRPELSSAAQQQRIQDRMGSAETAGQMTGTFLIPLFGDAIGGAVAKTRAKRFKRSGWADRKSAWQAGKLYDFDGTGDAYYKNVTIRRGGPRWRALEKKWGAYGAYGYGSMDKYKKAKKQLKQKQSTAATTAESEGFKYGE